MSYSVRVTPAAQKQIRKLDPQAAKRIRVFLEGTIQGIADPRSLGTALIEQSFWRYRVGDYRVIVAIDDGEVIVLVVAVAHRREAYRNR